MAYAVNAAVLTTATLNQDVTVHGGTYLTVMAVAGPTAAAAGDVSVAVLPYDDNPVASGPSLAPLPLPAISSAAGVLSGGKAYQLSTYLVAGIAKCQIQAKNNNAGTLPVAITYDFKAA